MSLTSITQTKGVCTCAVRRRIIFNIDINRSFRAGWGLFPNEAGIIFFEEIVILTTIEKCPKIDHSVGKLFAGVNVSHRAPVHFIGGGRVARLG